MTNTIPTGALKPPPHNATTVPAQPTGQGAASSAPPKAAAQKPAAQKPIRHETLLRAPRRLGVSLPTPGTPLPENCPEVWMPSSVRQRLDAYIRHADIEVSGFGRVQARGNQLHIVELFLPKQYGNSGATRLDDRAVGMLLAELDDPTELRCWWHSHAGFDKFWSMTDVDNIERLGRRTPWLLSLESCHRGGYLARLDVFQPLRLTIDRLPVFEYEDNVAFQDTIRRELDANVQLSYYYGDSALVREVDPRSPAPGKAYGGSLSSPGKGTLSTDEQTWRSRIAKLSLEELYQEYMRGQGTHSAARLQFIEELIDEREARPAQGHRYTSGWSDEEEEAFDLGRYWRDWE